MVKEFQQLRKQVTQILAENHQQKQETIALIAKEVEEKERLFLDLIKIIEQLALKTEIATKLLKQEPEAHQNLPDTYNNIKNDLIQLLAKYNVQPIIGQNLIIEPEKEGGDEGRQERVFPKYIYSYQGKILNE